MARSGGGHIQLECFRETKIRLVIELTFTFNVLIFVDRA